MRPRRRKHVAIVVGRATCLVLLAVVLQRSGWLLRLESQASDARAQCCQSDRPPPAPSLVHLDIDDNSLDHIGHWPWPHATLARMVDEIGLAKPKVLALDVLFADPSGIVYGKDDSTGIDGDQLLATAIRRLGCVVVPMSLRFDAVAPPSPYRARLLPLLMAEPDRTEPQCLDLLRADHVDVLHLDRDPLLDTFARLRQAAVHDRIERAVADWRADGASPDPAALRRSVLPHADPLFVGSVLDRLFDEQLDRVVREHAAQRFTLPVPRDAPPLLHGSDPTLPVRPMADAAAYGGFVDYLPESIEGTVRSVPLLAEYRGRMVPQMGLVAACAVLNADLSAARLDDASLTIPRVGGPDVVIPVMVRPFATVGNVGMLMDVPLFGRPQDWLTMYDSPAHVRPVTHLSAYRVYQVCETLDRLQTDRATADLLLGQLSSNPALHAVAGLGKLGPADNDQRLDTAVAKLGRYIHNLEGDTSDPDTRQMLTDAQQAYGPLRRVATAKAQLEQQLDRLRASLRSDLQGKAIFFGGVSNAPSDKHPTALFRECPGIVIHGAIYNSILTGSAWRRASETICTSLTVAAGLLTLLLVTALSPRKALVGALALVGAYLALNGYVLFARHGLIVEAIGPTVAVGLMWGGTTLGNFLAERTERGRIARLLRSYQDPALADYMLAHPEHVRFDGEERELTVGFADLAGFTALTDELGARVVPLLAEYMGHMAPVIRARGTVLQQLGDGILFLFGAPRPDPDHPAHAIAAALAMHAEMEVFNRTLVARGDRPLSMRIGLATGPVVVGDAGPPDDYTYLALGATTNLAARLESANKSFGTRTLISARTAELLGDRFLLRPIANLRVAGKMTSCMVHEPLCALADATDHDRQMAALTTEMVDAYRRADLPNCARLAADLSTTFGPSKLATFYADLAAAGTDHVDGQIVLTEK